ncbi:MAG TPA: Ig-like domain-containing protein, partial [Bacillota bacterium]
MERKTILALLLGLSVFSVFSIGYCSNGPLVYEMDFKNDKFYQSSDRGVLNEFYLYLPADTPQPGKYEFMPLGRGKKHYINSKSNLKIRNYSIKVWYEVWVSDNPSDRTVRNDNTPFFKIYSCNTEGEISDKPIVEEKFYNGRRQGNFILEKDKGFFIILNTGKWYHHFSQFARGYRSWYKITYQLDTTAPNAPAVDRIEVNGKSGVIRDQDNNTIYTNNDPIVLIWEAPKDLGTDYEDFSSGPSGVKDYLVYKDGNPMERQGKDDWVTTPQYEFSSLAEGKYKIQIKARDNENNESRLSDPIYLEVDRSVGLVSFADNPIEFSLTGSQKTVTAHWKELDDACGIKEYQVQLRQKNSSGAYDSLEEKKGGMLSQPFTTNLSSRYLYQIRVRAVDNLGNIGNWRNTADFSPPPSPAEIISVEPIAKIINDDKPSYQVKLTLEDVDAAKYVVERQNVGSSTWEKLAEISYNDLREANFEFIDTSVTKHGKYIYRVYTKNVLDHTSEYRSTNEQTIPNIPAEFAIIGPENNTYTNQTRWTIDINPKVDIEGDEIRFRVGYQPTGGNPQYIPDNMQTQAIEVEFPEGEGEWWVETAEYVDENEIPGSRQSTYNHSRSITIDFGFPDGGFELAPNLTNNQNIKLVNIYANDNLGLQELLFWNGTVEDRPGEIYRIEPAGEISEDILDKVAAGTAGISIAVSGTEVRIAEAIPWRLKDQDGKQEIAMEIRDRAGNSSNENPERDPVIRTVFLDRTPPSPPEEIQYRHAINAEGDPVIVFTVKAKKPDDPLRDIEKFTGICTLPDGTGISIDDNNISYTDVTEEGERYLCGTVEIKADPEEIGFNKQVTIAVASLDAAGNRSAEKPCYAWTLPKLGALARDEDGNVEAEAGYDWSTKKHYIRFKLQDQGEAAYHLLEAGETGEVGFPDVLTMGEGNFFTHNERNVEPKTNLTPRGKYKYRLVAVNDGGDRVYGDEFHYTLPNFPPGAPVPETPVGYARDYVEFRFTGVTDPDGDPVNYKVYIAEGTGPFTEVEPTVEIEENDGNLEEKVKFAIDKLSHGQTYAWYVEAYDEVDLPGYEQGITASETVWFTVDTAPPVLTIQDTMDNYTNLKQLTVTVSDALSGVKELSYQMLSVADNSVVKAGTIAINSGGGEEATRSIPLPEGRYHLQLSVEDRAGNRAEQNLNNLYVDYTAPEIDIANTGLLLQPVNGKYMVGPNFIPVKITAADGNSGLHRLRYWFTGIDGKDGGGGEIGLSPNINQYTPYLHMTGENGKEYDLEIQVTDRAGNESPVTKIGRVLLDRTAPEVSLTLTGLIPYNGKYYLGAIKDLKAELTTVDPESGIKEVLFAIREPGGSESGWGDWEKTKSHITTTGAVYQVGVKAINGAGSETIYYSEEFIYDNDAPEILAVNIPSGELVSGETAIIGIEAVEADSPITEYRLAVGN